MQTGVETTHGRVSYSVKEAARLFGCSERLLRKELALGHIEHFRISRRVMISSQHLQNYIDRNTAHSTEAAQEAERILKTRGSKP